MYSWRYTYQKPPLAKESNAYKQPGRKGPADNFKIASETLDSLKIRLGF